ncbi:acyltransferase family protein [Micromonospora sp. NPDC050397]|uniref:acyltransferase family protein n=1 Tax=Micromonospora sp. NPDC050397 TaxID=3364279 RepID=UPI00384B7BDE
MATQQVAPTSAVDRTRRIAFLEGVRGIAAFLVVLQHLLATEYPAFEQWTQQNVDFGRVGVVAFFLVSGYVIPLSLAGQTLPTFAVRRFFRLYPVYWLALAVYAVIHADEIVGHVGAPVVGLNLLMLQGLIGAVSILPTAWTLSIELLFYAQSAVFKARRLLDASVYVGWAWLALYVLLCVGERVTGKDLPTTLPLLLYIAGVGHALNLRDNAGSRAWMPLLAAGAVVVPAGAYVGVDGSGEWPPFTYSASFLVGLALFAAFYLGRSRGLGRPLIFLGAISYAVYLSHPIVADILHDVPGLDSRLALVAANLVVVVLVSWAAHRFFELPSIQLGKRLTGRRPRSTPFPGAEEQAVP